MLRTIVGSSLIVFASYAAFAQTAPLSFEAASLKLTKSPEKDGRVMRQLSGGPGSSDPGRFTFSNVTLKILVQQAYNLKEFQVEGPDWIDSEGYDLVATMAKGTAKIRRRADAADSARRALQAGVPPRDEADAGISAGSR